ncbi:MAG: cell division protein ZapE, partial [Pseudomonadota bacterium]|nr:cell division protein ZapE [Pseudomonadota bacterium]
PERLYENGLQRHRFIPCIDALLKHTQVLHLDSETDYRLRVLEQADLYFEHDTQGFIDCFEELTSGEKLQTESKRIAINGRGLLMQKRAGDVIWFDFRELCHTPRSVADYIELARLYTTIFISDVTPMGEQSDEAARRFINMIDEFYDRQVKVILSAEVPMEELYGKGRLSFEFKRTLSRLTEMQSTEYLALPHLP